MGILFLFSAFLAVIGAILMVSRRNPVYGLLFLLVSFAGAAGIFYSLNAAFLAVSQVLVYAGALSVLFLFVLMFVDLRRKGDDPSAYPQRVGNLAEYDPDSINTEDEEEESDSYLFSLPAAIFSVLIFVILAAVIFNLPTELYGEFTGAENLVAVAGAKDSPSFGSVTAFGWEMVENYALHYEVVGFIVLVGVIGAVVLGKRIAEIDEDEINEDAEHAMTSSLNEDGPRA